MNTARLKKRIRIVRDVVARLLIFSMVFTMVFSDWSSVPWATLLHTQKVQAANYTMQTGYYIGNGLDDRKITGLGFTPDLVMIKDDTANGSDGVDFKTSLMSGEDTAKLGDADTNVTSNYIQSLDVDGFTVGTALDVNAINIRYTWIAFGGSDCTSSGTFCVGQYVGNGTSQPISTGFQPDLVTVKRNGSAYAVWKSSSMAANTTNYFYNGTQYTATPNQMITLAATGFSVGNNATVNTNLNVYNFFAFKQVAGLMDVGTYVGNATDNRSIDSTVDAGLTFRPDFVFLKNSNAATAITGYFNSNETYDDYASTFIDGANVVDVIQKLLPTGGFQVGSLSGANGSGNTIYYAAFGGSGARTSSGTYKMATGSYVGTGATSSITNIGFAPDLVIIKNNAAQQGVFRTRMMPGNSTAYFAAATANFVGGISSLDNDGFTVVNNVTVNTSGNIYYWVAYGNAWNPDTMSGASDFFIGAYTGAYPGATGSDNRDIVGLPFQPDLVTVKRSGASLGVWSDTDMSVGYSGYFSATAEATNVIQTLGSATTSFQVGTSAEVNTGGNIYWTFGFKKGQNFTTGNYLGNNTSQNITAPGFSPNNIWIKKATGGTARGGVMRTSAQVGNAAQPFLNVATITGGVTALIPTGFSVGNSVYTNEGASLYDYRWVAWKITATTTASSTGTQETSIQVPSSNMYLGGAFTFQRDYGTTTISQIVVSENGTVNASTSLNNIKLYYETATSCSYDGDETLFGSSTTFNSQEKATTTGSMLVSTDQVCVYAVLDVGEGSGHGETIELEISNPNTDVSVAEGNMGPTSAVAIPGTTTLEKSASLHLMHYHWRDNLGTETTAGSLTGGVEDTAYLKVQEQKTIRLRIGISNEGGFTATTTKFRLEYGTKVTSCDAIESWMRVGDSGGAWDTSDSINLTDGADTTNIATSSGGVTDENTVFLTPNGGVKDLSDETGDLSLTGSNFVELEYSIKATADAVDGTNYCFRVTGEGTPLQQYVKYPEAVFNIHLEAGAVGTQYTSMDIPKTNGYVGGAFIIEDKEEAGGAHTITDITLSENGTVNAQTNLNNIKLYYDLDTSFPYDCASENYEDGATQFGSTDTDGFSSANGVASFSGSVLASTTQSICLYTVLDVASTTQNGETLEIQITSPSLDITAANGDAVRPSSPIEIAGTTTFQNDVITQVHYHWRNDNGDETTATAAVVLEDFPLASIAKSVPKRLRLEVSNEGATSSASIAYRLEYGTKVTTCADVVTWTDVGSTGGDFMMFNSTNLTDGNNTTNIATTTGGVTDENTNFLVSNGGVKDVSSQTVGIILNETQFVELEYSLVASSSAVDGDTYCFRLSDAGTSLPAYGVYPEVTVSPDVLVSATGTQVVNLDAPTTNNYIGGAFVIRDASGSRNVTDITITETGSVNAQTNLNNIKLYYDLDTSFPYDCASENYEDGATQFGSTDTDGFSSANGVASFSGSVGISTTATMCTYVVLDVLAGAENEETLDVQITNPSLEVTVSDGVVVPAAARAIVGSSNIRSATLTQAHYHWRNDNGTEASATSLTGGVEDTAYAAMGRGVTNRLRFEVSNEGATTSVATAYRIEYGTKVTTCSDVGTWTDVGAVGGDFDMSNSAYLTDGNDTTDIANGIGGVTNENTDFKTPNAGVKDISSETGDIILSETQFAEIEYSIMASSSAVSGDTYCFRLSHAGTDLRTYAMYAEATIISDATVSATGTQTIFVDIPKTSVYIGGAFVIKDDVSSHTVTSITFTETGTVDAEIDLDNIKLFYDQDITAPYDCASENYEDGATQFGSTDTDSFSSANGVSSFSGLVNISTTSTMCVYTILDVGAGATNGETVDVQITSPETDVILDTGEATPGTTVELPGSTTLRDDMLTQIHYHWRNNLGTEVTAGSLTGGIQDTAISNVTKNDIYRLRLEVSNEGATSSASTAFRLEYGKKITSCSDVGAWTDVGAVGGHFEMDNSSNLTDGNDTTNIATSSGGVADENSVFKTPNSAVKDTSSQVSTEILSESEFMEMEFSLSATDNSDFASTYCFRVTNTSVPLTSYGVYPELTIRDNKDFNVIRGVATISGTSTVLYNGTDYNLLSGSSTAFIRTTNTQNTGAGHDVRGATQNARDVTAYFLDPNNIESSVTITRPNSVASSTRVAWEIVEYIGPAGGDNEMRVRGQSTTAYTAAGLVATSTVVSGVATAADVVVFITGQGIPDATATNYNHAASIASWSPTSTAAVFQRGEGGVAATTSWAVVEYTGKNWKVQRIQHIYTVAGIYEAESITSVSSLDRTFLVTQKLAGVGLQGTDEFGHEVYLSGVGEVSFMLQLGATTPNGHRSVAWVIENTQTNGVPMAVTRSSGTRSNSGAEPETYNASIGKTLSDLSVASIFTNNRSTLTTTLFPQSILSVRLISATQYEVWRSDTGAVQDYRTEVVEWPTAVRTITQNFYQFFADNDALIPTDIWPPGVGALGENTSITESNSPLQNGDLLRIRMSLNVSGATLPAGAKTYKLQYGLRSTTCSALTSEWQDVGPIGDGTAVWRGFNGTSTADGTNLSGNPPTGGDLLLSVSARAGTYEEQNDTTSNPYAVTANEDVEYDWLVQRNGGVDKGTYCFRMVENDGVPLDGYEYHPTVTTAGYGVQSQNWRWYDDAQNETPTSALELENVSPIEVDFENAIKLRVTLKENAGASGLNQKFKLQYSTQSDFSVNVNDVVEIGNCTATSSWCYHDGGGANNSLIASSTLSDANLCSGGTGNGCGTYNESGILGGSYTHVAGAAAEHEFTLSHAGAEPNTVYYFRAYDVTNNNPVPLGDTETYPSLSTKGASLTFTVSGLSSGITTEGIITDVTTTPTQISFGDVSVGTEIKAAQRFNVTTNAPKGYQILMYGRQGLLGQYSEIDPVTSTNISPLGWDSACLVSAKGCFGYHAGDDSLEDGSGRFSADNTYAKIETDLEEIAYSSFPVTNDSIDMIYRLEVSEGQEGGLYEGNVVYIIVPRF